MLLNNGHQTTSKQTTAFQYVPSAKLRSSKSQPAAAESSVDGTDAAKPSTSRSTSNLIKKPSYVNPAIASLQTATKEIGTQRQSGKGSSSRH